MAALRLPCVAAKHLRILTYNIWFSHHQLNRRMAAIAHAVATLEPHVVCFQEMTDVHFSALRQHAAIQNFSWTAPPRGARYYTLIGSTLPMSPPRREPFNNTGMDRDLLSTTITPADGPPLHVATSHFESLDFVRKRAKQIATAFESAPEAGDALVCGDTNVNEDLGRSFTSPGERVALPSGWVDAWTTLRPGEAGATFDVDANRMVHRLDSWARTNRPHQIRPILDAAAAIGGRRLAAIELVGTEPIPPETAEEASRDARWWPSDHFGLLLTLEGGGGAVEL